MMGMRMKAFRADGERVKKAKSRYDCENDQRI